MSKQYDNLVNRLGADGAKRYMSELRAKVKKPGLASASPEKVKEISKLGNEAKREKISTKQAQENPPS